MAEVGTAYVTILPSTRGFQKNLEKELGGGIAGTGQSQGKRFGSSLLVGAGAALKGGAIGVGIAAGAALSTALVKGFGRLTAIENAEAQLAGLGHSTQAVARIMDNALASVKGTAFGLDEAASVAASAVAAGVKPGKQLRSTLTLVGDAATIAGSSLSDMGLIFNKVATSNKIQGDVINQLNERGIPIVQLLGKELGKTSAEVLEMSRKGEIGFTDFQKAMNAGLGGSALKSGNTTQGALKNLGAAVSRFGASLLSGVFPLVGPALNRVTAAVDAMGAGLGPLAARVAPFITQVKAFGQAWAANVLPIVRQVATAFAANLGPALSNLGTLVTTRILPALVAFGGWIGQHILPTLRSLYGMVSTDVLPVLGSIATWVTTRVIPAVARLVGEIAQKLRPSFEQAAAVIRNDVIPMVQGLIFKFNQARPFLQRVVEVVGTLVGAMMRFYASILSKVWPVLVRFVGFIARNVVPTVSRFAEVTFEMVEQVTGYMRGMVDQVLSALGGLVGGIAKIARTLKLPIAGPLSDAETAIDDFRINVLGKMDGFADAMGTAGAVAGSKFLGGVTEGLSGYAEMQGAIEAGSTPEAIAKMVEDAKKKRKTPKPDLNLPSLDLDFGNSGAAGVTGGEKKKKSKALTSAEKAGKRLAEMIGTGFVAQMKSATPTQIRKSIAKLITQVRVAFDGAKERGLVSWLKGQRTELIETAKAITANAKALERANALLADATSLRDSVASSAFGSVTQLRSAPETRNYLKERLAQVKAFGANIRTLAKRKLPTAFLRQIIDAGLDGAPLAAALARSSDADFSQIVSSTNALTAEANKLGGTAVEAIFGKDIAKLGKETGVKFKGVGIAAAQGIVTGLRSKAGELKDAMKRLARELVDAIKKKLKINSPSKVTADEVGDPIVDGPLDRINARRAEVASAMRDLVTVPKVPATPNFTGSGGVGGSLDGLSAAQITEAVAAGMARADLEIQIDPAGVARLAHTGNDRLSRR